MAWADEISAVCPSHEYLASELINWLTTSEFWFFMQAQLASAAGSLGQRDQVWRTSWLVAVYRTYFAARSERASGLPWFCLCFPSSA